MATERRKCGAYFNKAPAHFQLTLIIKGENAVSPFTTPTQASKHHLIKHLKVLPNSPASCYHSLKQPPRNLTEWRKTVSKKQHSSTPTIISGRRSHTLTSDEASSSTVNHKYRNRIKRMDFFARPGADPPPHSLCGKGLQRRMAEKDAVLCFDIYDSRY